MVSVAVRCRRCSFYCTIFTFVFVGIGIAPRYLSAQGRLQKMREEVRTAPPEDSEEEKHRPHNYQEHFHFDGHDDEDHSFSEFLSHTLFYGLISPFWGPPALVGDNYDRSASFRNYPYQHSQRGGIVFDSIENARPWRARVRSDYADDFSGLSSLGGQLLLESASRFGFDTEIQNRRETVGLGDDNLWTGDSNIVFRFAQSEYLEMRTGIGVNWLSDSVDTEFGVNFTYGGDLFLRDPWIVSAELDLGRLGHSQLIHVRSTIGVQFHRMEVFTGFDHYAIGDVEHNGLVSGIRFWW